VIDHETHILFAHEQLERLRTVTPKPAASSIRFRLGDWLVRTGRRLAAEVECPESSALPHEALARRAH
jgi:hypothetical protein